MSIATKRGDSGQTGLAGGVRVSKSSLRVEAYGTVDELNSVLGIARSQCQDSNLRDRTKSIQRELFRIGSGLATPPDSRKPQVPISEEMVESLTAQVHEIEAMEGLISDWSLPGEYPAGAFFDHAANDLPACRTMRRPRYGIRRRDQPEYPGISQSSVGSIVAIRAEARSGCRR